MDLAARNVLVDSGLVCKVSDFGLTRKVDPFTGIYTQTKAMKLPIKWMAGEHARCFAVLRKDGREVVWRDVLGNLLSTATPRTEGSKIQRGQN